jgi:hypothetical protein
MASVARGSMMSGISMVVLYNSYRQAFLNRMRTGPVEMNVKRWTHACEEVLKTSSSTVYDRTAVEDVASHLQKDFLEELGYFD